MMAKVSSDKVILQYGECCQERPTALFPAEAGHSHAADGSFLNRRVHLNHFRRNASGAQLFVIFRDFLTILVRPLYSQCELSVEFKHREASQ